LTLPRFPVIGDPIGVKYGLIDANAEGQLVIVI
jgi:hypothetical protein